MNLGLHSIEFVINSFNTVTIVVLVVVVAVHSVTDTYFLKIIKQTVYFTYYASLSS